MDEPSASRPLGMKKRKQEEKSANRAQRVTRSVDKMDLALEPAANDKRRAASLGRQLEILKSTPMPSDEKRRMPVALRSDAASLFSKQNVKSKLYTSCRTAVDVSTLGIAPSYVVKGPKRSSFRQFSDTERTDEDATETGSTFSK